MTMSIFRKINRITAGQKSKRAASKDLMLQNLISRQEWDRVERLLKGPFKCEIVEPSKASLSFENLVVHLACHGNAPLQTIMKLCESVPASMATPDDNGRYPLHVAVAIGCRLDVTRFLIKERPEIAKLQDNFGKTPMHYAGETYSKMFIHNHCTFPDFDEVRRNTLHVVKLLIEAAPQSVNIEDKDDLSPIEYALLSSSHISIVKTMQRASRKEWKRQKKEEKEKRNQELAKDLQARSATPTSTEQKDDSIKKRNQDLAKYTVGDLQCAPMQPKEKIASIKRRNSTVSAKPSVKTASAQRRHSQISSKPAVNTPCIQRSHSTAPAENTVTNSLVARCA